MKQVNVRLSHSAALSLASIFNSATSPDYHPPHTLRSKLSVICADLSTSAQAISDLLGVRIYIITSYQDSGVIEITPNSPTKSERFLYLSFWAEVCLTFTLDHTHHVTPRTHLTHAAMYTG